MWVGFRWHRRRRDSAISATDISRKAAGPDSNGIGKINPLITTVRVAVLANHLPATYFADPCDRLVTHERAADSNGHGS